MRASSTAGGSSARPTVRSTREALRRCRLLFLAAALFGVAVNLLLLTGPLYMLQVYDRVLVNQSLETLAVLTIVAVAAYVALGVIDKARVWLASKASLRLERLLGSPLARAAWSGGSDLRGTRGAELMRDLDTFRGFVGGPAVLAVTDLPFAPLFVVVIALLHPYLGMFAAGAILMLAILAAAARWRTGRRLEAVRAAASASGGRLADVATAADSVRAMGMTGRLEALWRDDREALAVSRAETGDIAASFKAATKASRFAVQSLILGLGAYLVIHAELSAGGMIAASIILGRALAPIEQALAAWSQLPEARAARREIDAALAAQPSRARAPMSLPTISGAVAFDDITHAPPGGEKPLVARLSLQVPAGLHVGVIGPSGAGKSTFLRLLVGASRPDAGCVRLDGSDIAHFNQEELGAQIGFLGENVGLLRASVRDNIARFQTDRDADVAAAAELAGAHQLIARLPSGYDTMVGGPGGWLSAGQRQRVGVARALFGSPRLIALDEPDAHLDDRGVSALLATFENLRSSGCTVFAATHSPRVVAAMDALLVLGDPDGAVLYGPRQKILARLGLARPGGIFSKPAIEPTARPQPEAAAREESAADVKGLNDAETV